MCEHRHSDPFDVVGAHVVAAAEQRERTARTAARAFGQTVTPTGVDAPVDTLSELVDRLDSPTTSDLEEST